MIIEIRGVAGEGKTSIAVSLREFLRAKGFDVKLTDADVDDSDPLRTIVGAQNSLSVLASHTKIEIVTQQVARNPSARCPGCGHWFACHHIADTQKCPCGKEDALPIDTCAACVQQYWACQCGASPIPGDKDTPPMRCKNTYCKSHRFRWVETRRCCQSFRHHLGTTCQHCGQKG